jgi:type IV pilus assembly protein PilM
MPPHSIRRSSRSSPARLYCNLGDITNLAVAQGAACRFTRVSTFGVEGIAQRLSERRSLDLRHARQWLVHVGLGRPVEEIEGDPQIVAATTEALNEGASLLVEELRRSLDYYAAQEAAQAVESVVFCGPGTAIPGLVDRLQADLAYPALIGAPAPLAGLDPLSRGRLTVSYGLALEGLL